MMPLNFTKHSVQKSFLEYQIIKPLKSGGFKSTYFAKQNGNRYVLKILDPKDIVRIKREIRAFKLVTSPYVARLLRYGQRKVEGKGVIFFVEEYVNGEDLDTLICDKNRLFDNLEILRFLNCGILAIESLWNPHKIVHRDIKPSNIIIRPDGDSVLLDLGIARHQTLSPLTPSGIIGPGTPGFMSPEQLKCIKGALDLRSDFFGLGICAYMMATSTHPFQANDYHIVEVDFIPKSPRELNQKIHVDVSNLIMKFLERKIYKRPRNSEIALGLIMQVKKEVMKNEKRNE